jgi:hypothetical protein
MLIDYAALSGKFLEVWYSRFSGLETGIVGFCRLKAELRTPKN